MIVNSKHIVSQVKWDLSFNEKEKVNQLQGKLSSWSKSQMLNELESIFNEVCPKDETWQIESLEIDLGQITYENLNYELPQKFREALLNKLKDAVYRGYIDGKPIKISENGHSRLMLLKNYLELGYMPWNYSGSISINSLLLEQLVQNKDELIDIIRRLAQVKQIRKRIAWQFNDLAIHKIIKELEPNNHEEIFDFTHNINTIQEKESIVQSPATEFKKNLWFWVFNYLFEERGTLFNRLHFMESSIRQMAKHYNISFEVLFEEIEISVIEVVKKTNVKGEFVQTLNLLSGKIKKETEVFTNNNLDSDFYLGELKKLLSDSKKRNQPTAIAKLNELVEQLYNRDLAGLKKLILEIGNKTTKWEFILTDLNENARETILKVLQPNQFKFIVETKRFFQELGHLQAKKSILNWESHSISFLISHRQTAFSKDEYVDNQLSKTGFIRNESSREKNLYRMSQMVGTDFIKRKISIDTFQILRKKVDKLLLYMPGNDLANQIEELLKLLFKTTKGSGEGANLKIIQPLFEHLCLINPAQVLQALKKHSRDNIFEQIFKQIVDRKHLHGLIKAEESRQATFLIDVYQVISNNQLLRKIVKTNDQDALVEKGFIKLLKIPNIGFSAYLNLISKYIIDSIITKVNADKVAFLTALIESTKLGSYEVLKSNFIIELNRIQSVNSVEKSEDSETTISESQTSKSAVKKWLSERITNNPQFIVEGLSISEKEIIVGQVIPNGSTLLKKFLSKSRKVQHNIDAGKGEELEFVFWRCLIDFEAYNKDVRRFEKLLDKAINQFIKMNTQSSLNSLMSELANVKPTELTKDLTSKITLVTAFIKNDPLTPFTFENISETLGTLLINHQTELRNILNDHYLNENLTTMLSEKVDFELFITHMFSGSISVNVDIRSGFRLIMNLAKIEGDSAFKASLQSALWKDALVLCQNNSKVKEIFLTRLQELFRKLALKNDISANRVLSILKDVKGTLPAYIRTYFTNMNPSFKRVMAQTGNVVQTEKQKVIRKAVIAHKIETVLESILLQNKVPYWFGDDATFETHEILNIMLESHEFEFYQILKKSVLTDPVLFRLSSKISFTNLVSAIGVTHPNQIRVIEAIARLNEVLGKSKFASLSAIDLQNLLFKKLITAWKTNNWRLVSPQQLWSELIWEAHIKYGIQKAGLIKDLIQLKEQVPITYQFALNAIAEQEKKRTTKSSIGANPLIELSKNIKIDSISEKPKLIKEGVAVSNAALVLINSYIPMLFERLELIESGSFKDPEKQQKAVNYLQYVVTGLTDTEEHHLVLNKVLCGLHPSNPVKSGLEITDKEKKLVEGMIQAIINYWPAIGECSIQGFRGNWLVRDGVLTEYEDKWILNVEKRAYDILINKSPFSFSLIKQKWMDKPIHVEWAY